MLKLALILISNFLCSFVAPLVVEFRVKTTSKNREVAPKLCVSQENPNIISNLKRSSDRVVPCANHKSEINLRKLIKRSEKQKIPLQKSAGQRNEK